MAKKVGKTKAKAIGKTKIKVGVKAAGKKHVKAKKPTGKPPKRVRMLMTLANKDMAYVTGHSYNVPQEVPVDTARRWIESGTAEEDKSLPDPPEHG